MCDEFGASTSTYGLEVLCAMLVNVNQTTCCCSVQEPMCMCALWKKYVKCGDFNQQLQLLPAHLGSANACASECDNTDCNCNITLLV